MYIRICVLKGNPLKTHQYLLGGPNGSEPVQFNFPVTDAHLPTPGCPPIEAYIPLLHLSTMDLCIIPIHTAIKK